MQFSRRQRRQIVRQSLAKEQEPIKRVEYTEPDSGIQRAHYKCSEPFIHQLQQQIVRWLGDHHDCLRENQVLKAMIRTRWPEFTDRSIQNEIDRLAERECQKMRTPPEKKSKRTR
jgi:hypothetical protein